MCLGSIPGVGANLRILMVINMSDDVNITERLVETGKIIGINVLDHIIISDGQYLSLMEAKQMQ